MSDSDSELETHVLEDNQGERISIDRGKFGLIPERNKINTGNLLYNLFFTLYFY